MPNPSPEVRKIDMLLDSISNEQQFVDFAQSPNNIDDLHLAVQYLVQNWPTTEQLQEIDERHSNPDIPVSMLDKSRINGIRNVRNLDLVTNYNPDTISHAEDAKLFWEISQYRFQSDEFYHRMVARFSTEVRDALLRTTRS